jgi:hypothetical protein
LLIQNLGVGKQINVVIICSLCNRQACSSIRRPMAASGVAQNQDRGPLIARAYHHCLAYNGAHRWLLQANRFQLSHL